MPRLVLRAATGSVMWVGRLEAWAARCPEHQTASAAEIFPRAMALAAPDVRGELMWETLFP